MCQLSIETSCNIAPTHSNVLPSEMEVKKDYRERELLVHNSREPTRAALPCQVAPQSSPKLLLKGPLKQCSSIKHNPSTVRATLVISCRNRSPRRCLPDVVPKKNSSKQNNTISTCTSAGASSTGTTVDSLQATKLNKQKEQKLATTRNGN